MPLFRPTSDFNGTDTARAYSFVGTGDTRRLLLRDETGSTVRTLDPSVATAEVLTGRGIEYGLIDLQAGDHVIEIRGVKAGTTTLEVVRNERIRLRWTIQVADLKVRTVEVVQLDGPRTGYIYSRAQAQLDLDTVNREVLVPQANIILFLLDFSTKTKRGFDAAYYDDPGMPYLRLRRSIQQLRVKRMSRRSDSYRTLYLVRKFLGPAGGYATFDDNFMVVSAENPNAIPIAIAHEFVHTHGRPHSQYETKTIPGGGSLMAGVGSPPGMVQNYFLTRADIEALHAVA